MESHIAVSVGNYTDWVQSHFAYGFLYRGVGDAENHDLIPSVGRYFKAFDVAEKSRDDFFLEESQTFRIFYKESRGLIDFEPASYWEWLAIAQHHGLPTRLLDWTFSSLTALYFAVTSSPSADAAVYVARRDIRFLSVNEEINHDPLSFPELVAFLPRHVTPRIRVQSGLFTCHSNPTEAMKEDFLSAKIIIPARYKESIIHGLNVAGINAKALFPDIDGLAKWLRWAKFDCLKYSNC